MAARLRTLRGCEHKVPPLRGNLFGNLGEFGSKGPEQGERAKNNCCPALGIDLRGPIVLDDRFHETCGLEPANRLWIPRWDYPTRSGIMARWRQALELAMSREDIEWLSRVARSRGEPARRVERAQMLLAYRENPSFFAVGQKVGVPSSDRRTLCGAGGGV